MKRLSGTSRRLLFAFTSLVVLFAVASFVTLRGLAELHELAHDVKHKEGWSRSLLELANASHDQHAQLAAAIIVGDADHLGAYAQAYARLTRLLAAVRAIATSASERTSLSEIVITSARLDRLFREAIAPAILANDTARTKQLYASAQPLIEDVQARIAQLEATADRAIDRFDDHAGVVQHSSFRWTLAALGAAIALAIVVGVYISRSIARPLARLADGATRLAAGDLTSRIEVRGSDEFARLAEQFNRMTVALGEHQARLIQSEKLAGIGRLAAGVAHEINNPLGVVLGYVRVVKRSSSDASLVSELQIIEDEALRCQEIVESLLDLARPHKPTRDLITLRVMAEEVIARLQHIGILAGMQLTLEGDAEVRGSSAGLRQILTNLLRNAAEAAGTGGRVGVRVAASHSETQLWVTDSGPGIEAAHRARLFEPFFTTKPAGTGLGLAISRSIARAHGGELLLEVDAAVTTFTLRLPQQRSEPA